MNTTRALVLGGGGTVGTAWTAGLVSGLRREGVDLAEADLIVGTSAGAIVGTMLATGQDLDLLDAGPTPTSPPVPTCWSSSNHWRTCSPASHSNRNSPRPAQALL